MFTRARGKKKTDWITMYSVVSWTSWARAGSAGSKKSMAHWGAKRTMATRAITE